MPGAQVERIEINHRLRDEGIRDEACGCDVMVLFSGWALRSASGYVRDTDLLAT